MQKKVAIIITPNWHDYAEKYLKDCIESLRMQDYAGEMKIFMTDNESTVESYQFITRIAPEVELILNQTNDGYAKGCNDSIRQALIQGFDYIAVLNIHTVLEKNYITEMVKALESDAKIGCTQGLMLLPDRQTISSLGNVTHFLGFGYCRGYNENIKNWQSKIKEVKDIFYPSGSSMLFKSEVLKIIGLFDEEYWMYNEDQEIGWRIWLAGYKCVLAPRAVIYNKYEFARSIKKYYWMDRNRILAILMCYHFLTLLLILPAFVIMELGLILFSVKSGWWREKKRVWLYFLKPKTWLYIFRARAQNQRLRKIKDSDIVHLISGAIWYQEVDDWKLRFINPIFELYWKICKFIIIW